MCTCVLVYLCICPQTQWLPEWSEIWAEAPSSRFRVLLGKLKNWVFTPVFSSKRQGTRCQARCEILVTLTQECRLWQGR